MGGLRHQEKALRSWLVASNARGPIAIVLGGSSNALSFARSLGRRGVPVLMLESERSLGTYTRYATPIVLPPVEDAPDVWIEFLTLVGTRLAEPGALFSTGDPHMLLVSRHSDMLARHFRFVVPTRDTVERIVDKRLQYGVAHAAGLAVPTVHLPDSEDALRRLSPDLPYPVLLKPYQSHIARRKIGRKLVVAASASELVSAYRGLVAQGLPVMVQEIVPGDDTALFGYLAFYDDDGAELAWLTKRKLRQYPTQFGDGSLQATAAAPEVAALGRRLVRAFGFRGFVGVEFKLDARDGTYYLMEINPRTVSCNQLAISAGVDFPWIGYRYLTGSPLPVAQGFRTDVTYVNEALDVFVFLAQRKSGALGLQGWLRSIRGAKARAVWARDDPMPLAVGAGRFASSRLRGSRQWEVGAVGDLG